MKARRLIYNRYANDFNNELEWKLQKVRILEENQTYYIVDNGSSKFKCSKNKVFVNKEDFKDKIDCIFGVDLTGEEKKELLESW